MASELSEQWAKMGQTVTVICPFPNRPLGKVYPGFKRLPFQIEIVGNRKIIRVWTWLIRPRRHHFNRMLENVTFGISSSLALLSIREPGVVILQSWPIAAKGMIVLVSRMRQLRVVNYVKDLYPEAMCAAGLLPHNSLVQRTLLRLDSAICNAVSCNVSISTRMKLALLSGRNVVNSRVLVVRDWVDVQAVRPFSGPNRWREEVGIRSNDIVFMYAGTMGLASRVDVLLDVAEGIKDLSEIRIVCVGEGILKEKLIRAKIAQPAESDDCRISTKGEG